MSKEAIGLTLLFITIFTPIFISCISKFGIFNTLLGVIIGMVIFAWIFVISFFLKGES